MAFDSVFRKILSMLGTVWACDSIFFESKFCKIKKNTKKDRFLVYGNYQLGRRAFNSSPPQEAPGNVTRSPQLTDRVRERQ